MLKLALGTTAWTRSQQQWLCDQRYPEHSPFCAPAPGLERNFKLACSFLTVGPAKIGLTYFLIPPLPQSSPATQTVEEMIVPGSLPCPCVHLCPVGHRFYEDQGANAYKPTLGLLSEIVSTYENLIQLLPPHNFSISISLRVTAITACRHA